MEGLNYVYDWKMSSELWMALVHSKPTEKLSVFRLIGHISKSMLSGQTENVQREVCIRNVTNIFLVTTIKWST